MTSRPPAVVCDSAAEVDRAAKVLAAQGWSVRADFELPEEPWDLSARRWACRGVVRPDEETAPAIWALIRGCALIVAIEGDPPPDFLDDLARCGVVEHFPEPVAEPTGPGGLDQHEQALLAALADGLSVQQAAAKLFLSTRTAQRRLTSARARLGVRTTREAVLAWTRLTG